MKPKKISESGCVDILILGHGYKHVDGSHSMFKVFRNHCEVQLGDIKDKRVFAISLIHELTHFANYCLDISDKKTDEDIAIDISKLYYSLIKKEMKVKKGNKSEK